MELSNMDKLMLYEGRISAFDDSLSTVDKAESIEPCPYCPCGFEADDSDETIARRDIELFHQACVSCSRFEEKRSLMCGFCQHLRLWHLIYCVDRAKILDLFLYVRKSMFGYRTDCPLCIMWDALVRSAYSLATIQQLEDTRPVLTLQPFLFEGKDLAYGDLYLGSEKLSESSWIGSFQMTTGSHISPEPLLEYTVSWRRLRGFIGDCARDHAQCQLETPIILPKGFRVVDVKKRCIVERTSCRFVALSYVWGQDSKHNLTAYKRTMVDLMQTGGLPTANMPRTIEDAIKVCEELGERYLWVDRLSIIQDDTEDKAQQIGAMGDIYSAAQFVIISAHGDGMSYGIPGVSRPRNMTQARVKIAGLTMTNTVREMEDDPLAVWNSRGWTYQESVLARKRLYFTDSRAYYECEHSSAHEDYYNNETALNVFKCLKLMLPDDKSSFKAYQRHLEHYSTRVLSFRTDIYAAFGGITKGLFGQHESTLYGLPTAHFDLALHWFSSIDEFGPSERECGGIYFPTWSWSSKLRPTDPIDWVHRPFLGGLTAWYRYDQAANNSISIINNQMNSSLDSEWQTYMAFAWSSGCAIEGGQRTQALHTLVDLTEEFCAQWSDYMNFYKNFSLTTLDLPNDILTSISRTPGSIVGRAQTTSLSLKALYGTGLEIINTQGDVIGKLRGNAVRLKKKLETGDLVTADFIALSLSGQLPKADEEKAYRDGDGNTTSKIPIIDVLMISWHGAFVQREAFGWVYLKDWAKCIRDWKTIILQ